MRILALDTATELCSAALWLDGQVSSREQLAPRAHGTLILPMIDSLLQEAGLALEALDAIAFGRGPGAFTGLRLAAAVAQGLGFAAKRPLIPVSDLRALAAQALAAQTAATAVHRVLICQDARMSEVYWACFEQQEETPRPVSLERVTAPSAVVMPAEWLHAPPVCAAGSGFAAYPELAARFTAVVSAVVPDLYPRAQEIARLAAEDGLASAVSAEEAQPVYLRDRVAIIAPVSRN